RALLVSHGPATKSDARMTMSPPRVFRSSGQFPTRSPRRNPVSVKDFFVRVARVSEGNVNPTLVPVQKVRDSALPEPFEVQKQAERCERVVSLGRRRTGGIGDRRAQMQQVEKLVQSLVVGARLFRRERSMIWRIHSLLTGDPPTNGHFELHLQGREKEDSR